MCVSVCVRARRLVAGGRAAEHMQCLGPGPADAFGGKSWLAAGHCGCGGHPAESLAMLMDGQSAKCTEHQVHAAFQRWLPARLVLYANPSFLSSGAAACHVCLNAAAIPWKCLQSSPGSGVVAPLLLTPCGHLPVQAGAGIPTGSWCAGQARMAAGWTCTYLPLSLLAAAGGAGLAAASLRAGEHGHISAALRHDVAREAAGPESQGGAQDQPGRHFEA